ncbi:hypothetical protein DFH09DRAFT_1505725 [Mycena vulgaris]|nr:hypothetical protein DFH09DRAFT_1505725 [Mycena vulgaris]
MDEMPSLRFIHIRLRPERRQESAEPSKEAGAGACDGEAYLWSLSAPAQVTDAASVYDWRRINSVSRTEANYAGRVSCRQGRSMIFYERWMSLYDVAPARRIPRASFSGSLIESPNCPSRSHLLEGGRFCQAIEVDLVPPAQSCTMLQRTSSHSSSSTEMNRGDNSSPVLTQNEKEAPRSLHTTTKTLRILAWYLHSILIATHFLLIGIWGSGLEHRITVPMDHVNLVSYLVTTATTTFGVTLARRCGLQMGQVLKAGCVPILGALCVVIYLAALMGLHITSSSLFSFVTFKSTRTFNTETQGLPALNGTPDPTTIANMQTYTTGSLYFLPYVLSREGNRGLDGGTLYDVLDTASVVHSNVTVDATGFNVTCGFLLAPSIPTTLNPETIWHIPSDTGVPTDMQGYSMVMTSTQPGMISTAPEPDEKVVIFYSTIPIIDSSGELGPSVSLIPPMHTSVSSIQIFRCSLSLVTQVAVVDSETQQIWTVEPDFTKTTSKWLPYESIPFVEAEDMLYPNVTGGNVLIDFWESWYHSIPTSNFPLDSNNPGPSASIADIYFIQKLGLSAANHTEIHNITLHDFENALSTLVAAMFWTCHIGPPYNILAVPLANGTITQSLNDIPTAPILLSGNATVTEIFAETQLEISAGLGAAMVLMAVLILLLRQSEFDDDVARNRTGIIHAMGPCHNQNAQVTTLLAPPHSTTAPERSRYFSTRALRMSAVALHLVLITTHVLLIVIWARGLENRITIALKNQKVVSYLITTTTTTFATIYSAVLIFIMQKLATRRNIQKAQMLKVTHDNCAAWSGIGAAILLLWNQRKVSWGPSTIGVISVITFLVSVSGLHITSSSLFSIVAFNSTFTYHTGTQGLPSFIGIQDSFTLRDMSTYSAGSLKFLSSILDNGADRGLHGGTLYDVLNITVAGNATVNATGFNVTCGSLELITPFIFSQPFLAWIHGKTENPDLIIKSTQPGMISTIVANQSAVIFYSTIPIMDSSGEQGPVVALTPPMNLSISSIQVFQCSLSLVPQLVVLDSQSQQLLTVEPNFTKTTSKWMPYPEVSEFELDNTLYPNISNGNMLIDMWGLWYQNIPASDLMLDASQSASNPSFFASVADIYFIQKLNLPANHSNIQNVTLHDFENALSVVLASTFWTLGHMHPVQANNIRHTVFGNGTVIDSLENIPPAPILVTGNATVAQIITETQLQADDFQVSAGLVVSILLMAVYLPLLRGSEFDNDLPIEGTGILHIIWLYRNHPALDRMLEQVEHPTDENLRAAGMVRTRLLGDVVRDEKKEDTP